MCTCIYNFDNLYTTYLISTICNLYGYHAIQWFHGLELSSTSPTLLGSREAPWLVAVCMSKNAECLTKKPGPPRPLHGHVFASRNSVTKLEEKGMGRAFSHLHWAHDPVASPNNWCIAPPKAPTMIQYSCSKKVKELKSSDFHMFWSWKPVKEQADGVTSPRSNSAAPSQGKIGEDRYIWNCDSRFEWYI